MWSYGEGKELDVQIRERGHQADVSRQQFGSSSGGQCYARRCIGHGRTTCCDICVPPTGVRKCGQLGVGEGAAASFANQTARVLRHVQHGQPGFREGEAVASWTDKSTRT